MAIKKNRQILVFILSTSLLLLVVGVGLYLLQYEKRVNFNASDLFKNITLSDNSPIEKTNKVNIDKIQEESNSNTEILKDAKSTGTSGTKGQCYWPNAKLTAKSPNDLSVVVNKSYCLPSTYAPTDLVDVGTSGIRKTKTTMQVRKVIVDDLKAMVNAIKGQGMDISALSCYRSYSTQASVYNNWVKQLGQAQADRVSARPGHSEHQLGTTCDFGTSENGDELGVSFANTKTGKWLAANASIYGFKMTYPEGQEASTGYSYEPWHWRYVGK